MRLEPDAFDLRSYTIIDEDDREQLMRLARGRVLPNDDGDRGSALPKASQLVTWLSYARNANIPVKQYLETQKIFDEQQLANVLAVYSSYEERKTAAHYLDFDDILRRCATVLISRREVRERIVGRIQHVLVDEIQDTSTLQWQLLHALRQKASLFCVGDDAQSIYAFRGADFKTVHSFAERVKGADIYYLTQNYRSTQEILDVSNWLLAESPLRYNKELQAIRGHATKPLLVECDDDLAQGLWVQVRGRHRRSTRELGIVRHPLGVEQTAQRC
jgi:DNA helicase-2/ATP-dependent DNA helicase PcrA